MGSTSSGGVVAFAFDAWSNSLAGHKNVMAPNSALLTDTYASPLRAQLGAANRER